MMSQHGSSDGNATDGKQQWKPTALDKQLDVMKRYECNTSTADNTTNATRIPSSTSRTSRKLIKLREAVKHNRDNGLWRT
jgi:hypothetical protein